MKADRARQAQAVVIGSSVAGLVAARVLAERFEQVIVVERDAVTQERECAPRRGVPQGHHAHLMLKKGGEILSELFPNFYEELAAAHQTREMSTQDLRWYHFDVWKKRFPSELRTYLVSRPLLERHLRTRLLTHKEVQMRSGCEMIGLVAGAGEQVTGVRLRDRDGQESEVRADLVVDCSGRGSNAPRWLEALGYARPEESHVTMNISYVSRLYEAPVERVPDWQALVIYPTPPHETRAGYVLHIEQNRWMVTLVGFQGEVPPLDDAGFLAFARGMGRPDIYEALADATPLTAPHLHKVPSNQRRHYERLARLPENFVVVGDALCSFNPIYGQGMTICAWESLVLGECLDAGGLQNLSRRYFKKAAQLVLFPWLTATGEDFRYPATQGKKPLGTDLLNRYKARLFQLAADDERVARTLYELQFLVRHPVGLFHPYLLRQALRKRKKLV